MNRFPALLLLLLLPTGLSITESTVMNASQDGSITWEMASLDTIGGHRPKILGAPKVVELSLGRAIEFDGRHDGLQVDSLPIAGWSRFTIEIVFRPAAAGLTEQRFLHLQENVSENRVLIETRLRDDNRWFLDTFIRSGQSERTLYAERFTHPIGPWYHAALVFDGSEMRHYVNGAPEMSGALAFTPLQEGRTSLGVRLNQVYWFKGAIRRVRFSPRPLGPEEFLKP